MVKPPSRSHDPNVLAADAAKRINDVLDGIA
jgi:hypothetical protein